MFKLRPPGYQRTRYFLVEIRFEGNYKHDGNTPDAACFGFTRGSSGGGLDMVEVRGSTIDITWSCAATTNSEAAAVDKAIGLLEGQPWAYPGILGDAETASIEVRSTR